MKGLPEGTLPRVCTAKTHKLRIISVSLSGQLSLTMACGNRYIRAQLPGERPRDDGLCIYTESVVPNKRKRKIPGGLSPELWQKLLDTIEDEELRDELRGSMVRALEAKYGEVRGVPAELRERYRLKPLTH